jgi:hypothetical protein
LIPEPGNQKKCKYENSVNGHHGMNPTGHYPHMFEEEKRKILSKLEEPLIFLVLFKGTLSL